MGYRVGVDVGGTFTDLICVTPDGEIVLDKTPSTLDDQSRGVMNGLGQLADRFGLSLNEFCTQLDILVHGTTTADNTMIEMNGANTGLLVTEGHRDEIELRRCHKEEIWDPNYPGPLPIARRRARIPIRERMDHTGNGRRSRSTKQAVRRGVQRLKQLGVRSIAVMYLFSFVNPEHERRTREIVLEEFPDVEHISLSHEVMPRGPEFERVSTTLVNAYVAPRIANVHRRTSRTSCAAPATAGPLLIMQSTGGVMPPDYVARRAVTLLASGPTGGVMGATLAANRADAGDFVAVDMGGTSFDICLVRHGQPQIKTDWNWRYRYYIGLPMVDVQSVGAGGGSIARVRQGALLVGPESAGSTPGPVCYGRGGALPDGHRRRRGARLPPRRRVRGRAHAARRRRGRVGDPQPRRRAARPRRHRSGVGHRAHRQRQHGQRHAARCSPVTAPTPRDLSLIAYGGNGAVHACAIARELGVKRIYVPKAAPAFSALGVLVADYVVDLVRSYVTPLSQVDLGRVRALMSELDGEVTKELAAGRPRRGRDRDDALRADVLPGPELRHERAGARRHRARRARPARPGRTVPRPARGRARVLLPFAAAGRARRARHGARVHAQARPLRRDRHGRATLPRRRRAPAGRTGARRGSTRRSTTAPSSARAPASRAPR